MQKITRTEFETIKGPLKGREPVQVTYKGKLDFTALPELADIPGVPPVEPEPTPEPTPDPVPTDPTTPIITHGSHLNDQNVGLPAGTSGMSAHSGQLYISPKTLKDLAKLPYIRVDGTRVVVTGAYLPNGLVVDTLRDVLLVDCFIKPSGVWPWGSNYAATTKNDGKFRMENCEVEGGKSIAIYGEFELYRVEAYHGSDLFRPQSGSSMVECWGHDIWRAGEGAHSDILQFTNNSDTIIDFTALRCKFEAMGWDPHTDNARDMHNAAIQTGSFNGGGGVNGSIRDCFFDGGNYTVNAGGIATVNVNYSGNKFGRNFKYGPVQATGGSVSFDNTNVWADTGLPVRG